MATAVTFYDLPDYLAFWHPVDDAEVTDDYLARTALSTDSAYVRLRVKNCSPDLHARDVIVSWGSPVPTGRRVAPQAPPILSSDAQQLVVVGGDTVAAHDEIGDIGPQETSATLTLTRRTVPAIHAGAERLKLMAVAAEWS
ncbi:hypothetical protein HH310_30055 [Actinoplanes sp. TBRC 11911]|uniref:hypothetical protein n=1 Tax=Actinoplanes sp. TBRC 11911 TaxID=2729386 RepID=UPI00145EACA8|nr:hypothetical protein [Actinoplanes sp. TBRC 11911]NMO55414.1 hypothetical protein [Actinoplanes sp. TBRC 11911]